jgi:hypothetical protein
MKEVMIVFKIVKIPKLSRYIVFLSLLAVVTGIALAAFTDKGTVSGATITTGSADIKMLRDLTLGATNLNLADELQGPAFNNVHPYWTQDYPIKIYNNSNSTLQLFSHADYETANDPEELRQYVFADFYVWQDANNNGIAEEGELGQNVARKTITKWKTEGFSLGQIAAGEIKPLILRLSTDNLSDTKQGKSATFDFEFSTIGQ